MTIEEIRELISLANESGVAELEVQRGDNRVRIRRASFVGPSEVVIGPSVIAAAPAVAAHPAIPVAAPAAAETVKTSGGSKPGSDPGLTLVKSPIVGTFYESPSPELAPFVNVGDQVQPGKVLCIIESMKLMNEIEAEVGASS